MVVSAGTAPAPPLQETWWYVFLPPPTRNPRDEREVRCDGAAATVLLLPPATPPDAPSAYWAAFGAGTDVYCCRPRPRLFCRPVDGAVGTFSDVVDAAAGGAATEAAATVTLAAGGADAATVISGLAASMPEEGPPPSRRGRGGGMETVISIVAPHNVGTLISRPLVAVLSRPATGVVASFMIVGPMRDGMIPQSCLDDKNDEGLRWPYREGRPGHRKAPPNKIDMPGSSLLVRAISTNLVDRK